MSKHECNAGCHVALAPDGRWVVGRIAFARDRGLVVHQHVTLYQGWPVVRGEVIRRHNGPRRGPSHRRAA